MGGRSRIRWHKVAKLALAGFGCLALFIGLPSLIRRPEPPPLEPDIGFAPLAASGEPAASGRQPERRAAQGTEERTRDRRRPGTRESRPRRSRRPSPREQERPATASPVTGVPGPAPVHIPTSTTAAAPPSAPPPPTPPGAQAQASQAAAAESEFGFER